MQKTNQTINNADSSAASSSALKLLWFSAQWCGPCKQMAPSYKAIQERYGEMINIEKIDVDEMPVLAENYQIRGVPSLLLENASGVVDRQVGALPLKELSHWLERSIKAHTVS